jgi:hypothetical protein
MGTTMRFQEIQKMAKGMGIRSLKMKKADLIRAIQRAENNIECYGTQRGENCQEMACLWKSDCLSLNNNRRDLRNLEEFCHSTKGSVRNISAIAHIFLSEI